MGISLPILLLLAQPAAEHHLAAERVVAPSLLAPGPQDLVETAARAERLVGEAEATGTAVARLQNRLGELFASGAKAEKCEESAGVLSLALRAEILAVHHRDTVQSARTQSERLRRLLEAPTVMPLISEQRRGDLENLRRRAELQVKHHLEMAAWQRRHASKLLERCKPALLAAPGVATAAPRGAAEGSRATALLGVGAGFLCPMGVPANRGVVIAPDGYACYGAAECTCTPAAVLPGAVLGP